MTTETSETAIHYHDPCDRYFAKQLRQAAPDAFAAFAQFDQAALRDPGKVIPRKYTELMALAVALTTQCVYCIEAHSQAALKEGATQQEIAETVLTTTALRAGGGLAHGMMALKFYNAAGSESREAGR